MVSIRTRERAESYHDTDGHSRSAIGILSFEDGLARENVCNQPVVYPVGARWKSAFVYAFDAKRVGSQLWMYYTPMTALQSFD